MNVIGYVIIVSIGVRSVQTYLLGDHSSRLEDLALPPPPGPTITDFFLPDSDLHGSGLCCSALDHRSALGSGGPLSLQQRLAREDYLTDSESDDEEEYRARKPTFSGVKDLIRLPVPQTNAPEETAAAEPAKGKKQMAKPASAAAPIPQTPLQETNRKVCHLDT